MTYTFMERHPSDWHEMGNRGWLFSAAFVSLTDEQMPEVASSIRFAYASDSGLSAHEIMFSGTVMKLYLEFGRRGRDAIRLAGEIFDDLHSRVPLRDVVFHDGVYDYDGDYEEDENGDPPPLDLVAAAEIVAPYGPQRPVDPDAPAWAPNQALQTILGF